MNRYLLQMKMTKLEPRLPFKPGLPVRRKHKMDKHKHRHKDVYTGDKHKHKVTYARAEAQKCKIIARPDCLLARDLIPTWRTRMYPDSLSLFFSFLSLRLCLCLRRSGLHVRRKDTSTSTSTREWHDFHSLVLLLMLASYV